MNRPGAVGSRSPGQHRQAPRCQETNMSNADRSKVRSNICDQAVLGPDRVPVDRRIDERADVCAASP